MSAPEQSVAADTLHDLVTHYSALYPSFRPRIERLVRRRGHALLSEVIEQLAEAQRDANGGAA